MLQFAQGKGGIAGAPVMGTQLIEPVVTGDGERTAAGKGSHTGIQEGCRVDGAGGGIGGGDGDHLRKGRRRLYRRHDGKQSNHQCSHAAQGQQFTKSHEKHVLSIFTSL